MKKTVLLLFVFFSANIFAQEIQVHHQIKNVTVYLSGAEIIRNAKVQIPQGRSTLIFKDIPSKIEQRSIKINIDNKNVTVLSIDVKNKIDYQNHPDWKKVDQKEKNQKEKIELTKLKIKSFEKQILFLENNMVLSTNAVASVNQLDARANYFQKKMEGIHIKIHNLKQILTKQQIELKKIDKERKKTENKIAKKSNIVRALIESPQAITTNIDIKYIAINAAWHPNYSINATDKDKKIDFKYQAYIYNNTGNDWENQKLTLAIINPNDDLELPVLKAWVIGNDNRISDNEGRLNSTKGKALLMSNTRLSKDSNIRMDYEVIKVEDIHTKFIIDTPQNIASDTKQHLIDIKNYQMDIDYYSLSIPKIKEGAYMIGKIPHWRQLNLMNGKINLYYNNTFQGISELNTQQISDTLDVTLGKDESFTVTKRKLKSANKTYMIGFNVTKKLTYEIVVKNIRNKNQSIDIKDQIPIASDSDIKIEIVDLDGAKLDKISGQLSWKVDLKPFETKKIVFSFNIKVPKNKSHILSIINDRRIRSARFF